MNHADLCSGYGGASLVFEPMGYETVLTGLPRTAQLRMLGNGWVPRQAAAAWRVLLERATCSGEAAA